MNQILKQYFSDPGRFADLFNGFLFSDGMKVSPENLTDCEEEQLSEGSSAEQNPLIDPGKVIRKRAVIDGEEVELCLYVMIDEKEADPFLPLTIRSLEALSYQRQREAWRNSTEGTKIVPVISLALYLGKKAWDGPGKLTDLLDPKGAAICRKAGGEFRVRLVSAQNMKRSEANSLTTDVREILLGAKYAGREKRLIRFVSENREKLSLLSADAQELFQRLIGLLG